MRASHFYSVGVIRFSAQLIYLPVEKVPAALARLESL
jgi:hypothetical protein